MTDIELEEVPVEQPLSRRRRRRQSVSHDDIQLEWADKGLPTKLWPALVWSLFLSVFSVANPYLTQFAANLQSQSLYAGMAMQMGQVPYENFFGTKGVLYYLMAALGSSFGTTWILVALQFIALLLAGIVFYKTIAYISQSEKVATSYSHWFYIVLMALDFGGLYAGMFALPFVLTSMWFLIRYFDKGVKDEWFILYGVDSALVFLIYPRSLILWLVAGLVLLVYNIRHHHLARGIYQLLATLFGFLLIVYVVGYYAFESQILGPAIQQTLVYNIRLNFFYEDILWTVGIVTVFLIFSGFLKNFLQNLFSLGQQRRPYMASLMVLAFFVQAVFIVGTANFHWNQLVMLLPYGFVMGALYLRADQLEEEQTYLRQNYFLPLLICLVLLAQPAYSYYVQREFALEREQLAAKIVETTDKSDKIVAWDNSAAIYLDSQRLAATRIMTAKPYLNTDANKESFVYDLNKNEAAMIVVNKGIAMPSEVKDYIQSQYSVVETTAHFILYQQNQ